MLDSKPEARVSCVPQQCNQGVTLNGSSSTFGIGVWLLILFWVALFSFFGGNAIAGAGECSAGWVWNPIQYIRLMSQLQSSPWSWTSPEMASLFQESRLEILGGFAAVLGSTAAMCVGGPGAATATLSFMANATGTKVVHRLADAAVSVGNVQCGTKSIGTMSLNNKLNNRDSINEQVHGVTAFSGKGNRLDYK